MLKLKTLPQHDGNANGQEQTGVTDDGQLCVMEDSGAVEGGRSTISSS